MGATARIEAQAHADASQVNFARPPMGWASWNSFSNTIDSSVAQQQAQAMVSSGMKAAGYQYLLLDEGWWLGTRDGDGNIVVDKQQWPAIKPGERAGDMANIVRSIHSLGLKAGIYTDAGEFGCGYIGPDIGPPRPHTGSLGHYEQDMLQFARWGFDYVKVDWCGGDKANLDPAVQYAEIARAIIDAERVTGHRLFYSICNWGRQSPWNWAPGIGGITEDMWRTGGDIVDPIVDDPMHANRRVGAKNILKNLDDGYHPEAQHTGYYNDLDMMVIGMRGMTDQLDRMHMSLWAVSGAPLMVGADLSKLTREQTSTLTNAEVLAIDQDPLGLQGVRVAEASAGTEVWSKLLAEPGKRAVVLLNRTEAATAISFSLDEVGLVAGAPAHVRDVWEHRDLADAKGSFSATVAAGDAVMLLVSGREPEFRTYQANRDEASRSDGNGKDCPFCSVMASRREYVRFHHVASKEPFALMKIHYASAGNRPFLVMMQVNGETPTRVQLLPTESREGTAVVEAPFETGKENTVTFWSPAGSGPNVSSIAVHER